ncbi:Wzz/FepE/Etk N-terminal domain-containing protein [Vibrio sp. Isolate23]|uniref:Wzz/FepE/Etk N-terminal domain-containing protein n=1 Tax=Vibrio sp. Isolate23 TaxID=2908533 RepID=UPI001EFDDC09|nr:Wzz/FepE/Etk N-terminal domain-containing protein [Vibrio sp. Isolate23]
MSGQIQQSPQEQQYSPQIPSAFQSNDEIDLRKLFKALWDGKFIIIATTVLFTVCATFWALKQPNVYRSQATFVLEEVFYGVSSVSEPNIPLQFLSSGELKNMISSEIDGDTTVLNGVSVSYNSRGKEISISKTSIDPKAAFDGVSTFSLAFNRVLKKRELEKVRVSTEALERQKNIYSLKTKEYLDELLAQQLFKAAILERPNSKLVIQISEAVKPKSHIKPKRALIAILGTLLGSMLGVAIVLIRFAFRREQD